MTMIHVDQGLPRFPTGVQVDSKSFIFNKTANGRSQKSGQWATAIASLWKQLLIAEEHKESL